MCDLLSLFFKKNKKNQMCAAKNQTMVSGNKHDVHEIGQYLFLKLVETKAEMKSK